MLQMVCCSVSDSLRTHGLQDARLPCPSLSPGVCSNSFIESMIASNLFILCHSLLLLPSIFPSIRVFSMSWLFTLGDQSIGASTSASVLSMNIQGWFFLGLTNLISLQSKRLSRVFSSIIIQKHQFFATLLSLWSNFHIHTWLLEKP